MGYNDLDLNLFCFARHEKCCSWVEESGCSGAKLHVPKDLQM